jgi:hypothetical protein
MALVHIQGENGLLCGIWEESALPDGIRHRLERGDLTRISPDGKAWQEPAEDAEDVPPPDAPALPKRTESRAVWQEFAENQGMDAGKAAVLTRAELIAEFTQQD